MHSNTNTHNRDHRNGTQQNRSLLQRFSGAATADGAGVKLTRIIGSAQLNMLDPFLLLDCFESDKTQDYIGGFPEHPHRGFETVTYLLAGRMRHKDSAGHEGVIESGGVQWMTAGSGVLHSEMPEQEEGLLKGFQLWVNLPAAAKMSKPAYQEYATTAIPVELQDNGVMVRVISGKTDRGTAGPVRNTWTEPTWLDISLPAQTHIEQSLANHHNAFLYVLAGDVLVAGEPTQPLDSKELGILSPGDHVCIATKERAARLLFIAAKPLNEPVVRSGPFVMNTQAEIRQAYDDYRRGIFSASTHH